MALPPAPTDDDPAGPEWDVTFVGRFVEKKGLDDLGVKQDLGDSILYGYRVKEPEKK